MRLSLPAILSLAIAAVLCMPSPAVADPGECVPGRAIVNWTLPIADRIQDYLEGKSSLDDATGRRGVEALFEDFGVTGMERLFLGADLAIRNRGNLSTRAAYEAYEARIRAMHPLRQARAPRGAAHVPTYGIFLVRLDPARAPWAFCRAMEGTGCVQWAEADRVVRASMTPNDTSWSSLWGTQRIGCATAWDTANGTGVVAAVIDTGIAFSHEDLSGQNWTNTGETASNSIDDDGNGLVDDTVGWDYVNNDSNPADDNGHGSHCAGTVAATGNNSRGIIGVGHGAKLMALKGMGASGSGADSALANCINYARTEGADVMSCSWGEAGYSSTLVTAIQNATSNGVLAVFAAGNSNQDGTLHSPSNCRQAISVAASTALDGRATFSCFGIKIDVTAPGETILSCQYNVTTGYVNQQGTSMACPHVAGALAVLVDDLVSRGLTTITVEQMRQILRSRAADREAAGWDHREGWGRLDVAAMMGFDAARACEALITFPDASDPVTSNSIAVAGSAWAPSGRFQDWSLQYGQGQPYDSGSWTTLATGTSTVQAGTIYTWDVSSLADGRYTLRLVARNDQSTSFTDRVDFVRDTVSDDASSTATAVVGSPSTYKIALDRNLNTSSDQDWFSMQCVQGVPYQFRTTMLSGMTDTVITLYQSNGTTQIATNDDYPNPGDKESYLSWTCTASGTYYIKVVGFSDASYPTPDKGSYRIQFVGMFPDGAEPDASAAAAPTIAVNGTASHRSIVPAGDDDWMKFSATAGTSYTIESSKVSASAATTLELVGTDGSTVLQTGTAQSQGHMAVSSWTCPATGTYYVRVRSGTGSCGHYLVRVYEKKDIVYSETFEVVGAALWTPTVPSQWTVAAGEYACTDTSGAGHFTRAGPAGWGSLVVDSKMRLASALTTATANNGVLLWTDDNTYVQARIRRDDLAELLQLENGTQALMASVARTFNDDADYQVRTWFEGDHAAIAIEGVVVATTSSRRFPTGRLGLRSFGCRGTFDTFSLWRPGVSTLVDFALSTTALPPGLQGQAYSRPLVAAGGTTPYTFAVLGSTAPPGLSLSAAGVLSGTPTASGTYLIQVSVMDAGLRLRAGVVSLAILPPTTGDTVGPAITVVSPANGVEVGTDDQVLRVDATDSSAVKDVRVRVNGGTWTSLSWVSGVRWELLLDLAEGSNTIDIEAEDYMSNVSSASITVPLDSTPPQVAFGTWTDGELSFQASITLDGTSQDAVSVTVNGSAAGTFDTGTGAWTSAVTLSYGDNVFTVRATDSLGRFTEIVAHIEHRLKGDVDADGDVDEADVTLTVMIESGEYSPSSVETLAADVDGSGTVDLKDAYDIRRVASGEMSFP